MADEVTRIASNLSEIITIDQPVAEFHSIQEK
jgi:hypothetical protein